MVKTLRLPSNKVGYVQISEIIILDEETALMLYTWQYEGVETRGWRYFNPANGELIGTTDGE